MNVSNGVAVIVLVAMIALPPTNPSHAQGATTTAATATASVALPADIDPESRNRLPIPKRDDMDDAGKAIYDDLIRALPGASGKVPAGLLPTNTPQPRARLWDPQLARLTAALNNYLKYDIGLSGRLLEIAILTTAYEMNHQYEWTQWEKFGQDPADPRHIEQSTIDIIKFNKPVTGLGEKDAAVITLGREMFGAKKVSSQTFAEVQRLFGRKGLVDLVWLMAFYSAAAAELTAFDQQLQAGQQPLLPPR